MSFNIIDASKRIANKYKRYLKTMFDIKDPDYKAIFEQRLQETKSFENGPYLDVTNSFEKGRSIPQLIQDGIISSDFQYLKRLYNIPNLHKHQEEALLKAIKGENLIVSTGTGSGKTECFLLPLINELMREKENHTLDDGVRALIIYPMNALANDQIDRLRKTFIDYPDITFGCYTGQTLYTDKSTKNKKGAIAQYLDLNGKRIDDVRLQKPLPNERLSREAMKERPPHILITNYAMLEYLMLRPEDNVFFDGDKADKWKYIILDEAHTYTGSTGIEVSMLLRRLIARLKKKNPQYILTSATLGNEESNKDVIAFAERLCSAPFEEENIIRATRIKLEESDTKYTLTPSFYEFTYKLIDDGYEDKHIIEEIENNYHFGLTETSDLGLYLYDLLICDKTFWKIKKFLNKPKSIQEIRDYTNFSEKVISAFVEVASKACKNQSKLFDSRYHMFLRATEGVFITLAPHKDLFLTRKNMVTVNDEEYKVFEAVTCTHCHALYLLGYIDIDNHLVQKSSADSDEIKEAFYIGNQANNTDEDTSLENSDLVVETYELCPHCGFIRSEKSVHKQSCGHDESHFIKLIKVKTTDAINGRVTKCIGCENVNRLGILRGFFSGQEASTSVIGTSLFEELPSHVKKIVIHENNENDGFDVDTSESVEEETKAKQFIAFSDSRQAAAYFSSYFSVSYDGILYGRLIQEVLNSSKNNRTELPLFISNLATRMKDNKIIPFDEYLHCLKTNSLASYDYEKVAWQAILKEFVDCNARNSLLGLGLLGLDFNNALTFGPHKKYNLNVDEVKNICMVFVMGMLADAAMYYPKGMNANDKEFFTHNGIEYEYLKDTGSKYVRAFIPQNDSLSNKRLDYLTRVLQKIDSSIQRDDVKTVLEQIWNTFFAPNKAGKPQIMYKNKSGYYKVNLENLVVDKNKKWYRCNKCNKITSHNVKDVCPSYHCDGKLEPIDIDKIENQNHYYRMYHDLEIEPLRVVEHTAQLNREEAYHYQNLFKEQKIDVLSCSTTFEMGVDVGDLETVFMRNMPPSASNYAQRAGRAGRSTHSAAFALTFCNKSNHDFNYFEKPTQMISGTILPPQFKVDNEKICIRHLYSSAFSYFFKLFPDYFTTAKDMMENCAKTGLSGYESFKSFLENDSPERESLKAYLKESVPPSLHTKFSLDSFGWVKWLFASTPDEYPSLYEVREIYLKELNILRNEYNRAKAAGEGEQFSFLKRIQTYEQERIISFLSRNNILPKYGFPVDTVELNSNTNTKADDLSGLDLSRDLSMAISEYAPGCQVVANNRLVTSRYIKRIPGFDWRKYDYIECEHCKTLNVATHVSVTKGTSHPSLNTCKQCGNSLDEHRIKTFLIPEFGFIADEKVGKPSLLKPEKTFRTEASFFSNNNSTPENKYKIGDTEVSVAMVGNDGEMAMLNTTDFFVCPTCGYAIETPAGTPPFVKTITDKTGHKDSKGYPCKTKELEKYSLGYKFKTDIIRIRINQPLLSGTKIHEEAYSILQALILAACRELNIENTEIAGCLQYYNDGGPNYSYILYDKTPGGAGHVKRLNNQDAILHILINAMNIATKCPNCDDDASCYSCLRTYQNQKHHDIIKRNYVFNYLGEVLDGYSNGVTDSKLEDIFLKKLETSAESWVVTGNNKNIYFGTFNGQKWTIEPQVYLDPTQNVIVPSKPDFMLTPSNDKQKKIAIFTDGFKYHNDIVNKDSIKRDAIIYSGNYRVWSLSWKDVKDNNDGKVFATEIFDEKKLPSKLNRTGLTVSYDNSFELLLSYLKNDDAENKFKETADAYFNAMIGKAFDKKSSLNELAQLRSQLALIDENNIKTIDKYYLDNDCQMAAYLIDDGTKHVVSYIQDYIQKRKVNFYLDWNAYIQFNNIMQFMDSFIAVSQCGLDEECYAILDSVINLDDTMSNEWKKIMAQIIDSNAKSFAKECIARNIIPPSQVGYELNSGETAELMWDKFNVVYLTTEQMEFKDAFTDQGFKVVNSLDDFQKITSI